MNLKVRMADKVLMTLSRRKKLTLLLLGLYWPGFFVLAHIPVPMAVRKAGMSDKTLHVIAYMLLSFLFASVVNREDRMHWRRARPWLVLLGVVWYGVIDELTQALVGRTADVHDYFADVVGCCIALIILTILPFWPAFGVVVAGTVFALSNLTTANPAVSFPVGNAVFHVLAYALFTLIWWRNIRGVMATGNPGLKSLILITSGPIGLLALTKVTAYMLSKPVPPPDILLSLAGIVGAVLVLYILPPKDIGMADASG